MSKWLCITAVILLMPAIALAQYVMSPRDMLFDPRSKETFAELTRGERVESIGHVLALDREKKLPRKEISKRAYKVDECVMKHIKDEGYKKRDVMTVITDCVVVLGYN